MEKRQASPKQSSWVDDGSSPLKRMPSWHLNYVLHAQDKQALIYPEEYECKATGYS